MVPDLSVFIPPRKDDSFNMQPLDQIIDKNPNSHSRNAQKPKLSFDSEMPREPLAPINKNFSDNRNSIPVQREALKKYALY